MTGRVFEIQRFCVHDGPGIRTTVFLKGCGLNCAWCHNPEGRRIEDELSFDPDKCIGCGYCFRACPNDAHRMAGRLHELDRRRCEVCGECTKECHARALELTGRDVTVEQVMAEVTRDRQFYEASGGGITLSGGEPMMQHAFAAALLSAARDQGLHRCMETSGQAERRELRSIMGLVDIFLYDIKELDDARHVEFTGLSNGRIVANLRMLHDSGARIIVRLPIVPGFNDREDHYLAVADLMKGLPRLEGAEVISYHALGVDKWRRLGRECPAGLRRSSMSPEAKAGVIARLRDAGVRVRGDEESPDGMASPMAARPHGDIPRNDC